MKFISAIRFVDQGLEKIQIFQISYVLVIIMLQEKQIISDYSAAFIPIVLSNAVGEKTYD